MKPKTGSLADFSPNVFSRCTVVLHLPTDMQSCRKIIPPPPPPTRATDVPSLYRDDRKKDGLDDNVHEKKKKIMQIFVQNFDS